ncbi:MAG: hypothetical protein RM347_026120 [Nostoc sp. ChiQUE02]|uniref:hypothetical protein n=1 Tax=Nostoc sp. ChiQUE02 TaxID=3075377 RepID=UPI002AD26195|nr:hypothetical protein [Nostoc sp. ChiQUE02]MDZ8230235.1 hypothetical protein [Nostoc sp. ChiQUE02]
MPLPSEFTHQTHPNLCAYYAAKHFLYGKLNQKDFEETATKYYIKEVPGIEKSYAEQLVQDGNDPAIFADVLQGVRGTSTEQLKPDPGKTYSRILLSLRNRDHFITVLKDDKGRWWNYDSLLDAPQEISNIDQFLKDNPASQYYVV